MCSVEREREREREGSWKHFNKCGITLLRFVESLYSSKLDPRWLAKVLYLSICHMPFICLIILFFSLSSYGTIGETLFPTFWVTIFFCFPSLKPISLGWNVKHTNKMATSHHSRQLRDMEWYLHTNFIVWLGWIASKSN